MGDAINVGVYGGYVQWVRGVPKNTELRVYDYDIDGTDPSIVSSDNEGHPCIVITYRGCDAVEVPL